MSRRKAPGGKLPGVSRSGRNQLDGHAWGDGSRLNNGRHVDAAAEHGVFQLGIDGIQDVAGFARLLKANQRIADAKQRAWE